MFQVSSCSCPSLCIRYDSKGMSTYNGLKRYCSKTGAVRFILFFSITPKWPVMNNANDKCYVSIWNGKVYSPLLVISLRFSPSLRSPHFWIVYMPSCSSMKVVLMKQFPWNLAFPSLALHYSSNQRCRPPESSEKGVHSFILNRGVV